MYNIIVNSTPISIFLAYGKVVECRINRGLPNNKVPFGFVVFDNEEPVKQLLGLKVSVFITSHKPPCNRHQRLHFLSVIRWNEVPYVSYMRYTEFLSCVINIQCNPLA